MGTLSPAFSANVQKYSVTVGGDVNGITISAAAEKSTSKVTVYGGKNLQVGENEASNRYVKNKIKDCEEIGIRAHHYWYTEDRNFNTKSIFTRNRNLYPTSTFKCHREVINLIVYRIY